MKLSIRNLVFSAAALASTAAFAATQARVDVPFSFTAKGQTYPAGSYHVSLDADQKFVVLASNTDATKQFQWTVGPADPAKAPAVIRFDNTGNGYALRTIQVGSRVTSNLDPEHGKHGISATTSIGGQ